MPVTKTRPIAAGIYPIPDATAFIRAVPIPVTSSNGQQAVKQLDLKTQHLFRWIRDGISGEYLHGLRGRDVALTFLDLISFRIVAVFRSQGVSSTEIKYVHDQLQKRRGWEYPFAMEPTWVFGPHIIIKESGLRLVPGKNWQLAFEFIEKYWTSAVDVVFDNDKTAVSWEPCPEISLNPHIRFGEPCVKGTRVPTETLWAMHQAGDSVQSLAYAYDLTVDVVEAAIGWEQTLAEAIA